MEIPKEEKARVYGGCLRVALAAAVAVIFWIVVIYGIGIGLHDILGRDHRLSVLTYGTTPAPGLRRNSK